MKPTKGVPLEAWGNDGEPTPQWRQDAYEESIGAGFIAELDAINEEANALAAAKNKAGEERK